MGLLLTIKHRAPRFTEVGDKAASMPRLQKNRTYGKLQETLLFVDLKLLPPQGFGPEVKTRGGIIVVRA